MEFLIRFYRRWQSLKRRFAEPWTRWPPVGAIDFGDLRRVRPFSSRFGLDRGLPVDRYYIEKFLQNHQFDIGGDVLEIGDASYTRKFGGDRVTKSDVLHLNLRKPDVTIVADLSRADHIPSNTFDCFIMTQTLQFIYDLRAALQTIFRILKPGGVLLATFPGISQIDHPSLTERWEDHWRFTTKSAQKLFAEIFSPENLEVRAHGNALAATAFLYGLAAEELRQEELDYHDPDYQVLITVRAIRM